MTEAKIPARWQKHYEGLTASKDFATLHCDDQIKLIEELGAAEEKTAEVIAQWNVTLDNWNNTIRERNALRDEVERLKDEHANQLMAIAQNEALRIAQYRRDALEEAACEAEGAHVNDERSDIARIIRELADKD